MHRIIVTTDPVSSESSDRAAVLLDEHVHSVHLSTNHAAAQLVQRLAWAVGDAESAESSSQPTELAHERQDRQAGKRTALGGTPDARGSSGKRGSRAPARHPIAV
jgi:hypothetical protein